ncbi:MAG: hypothetical protein KC684_07960 [Candidatus Omnitrophica bacterium]|nr:hypothetical protein [Candidatus Omnitrophota bacterium]
MKKNTALPLLLLLSILLFPQSLHAQATGTENFVVSFNIPTASSIIISAVEVDATTGQFGNQVTALNFSPATLDSLLGVFFPDHFFAIDVATAGGAGQPTTTISYLDGNNPNAPFNGLGWKTSATFVRVSGPDNAQVEDFLTNHGPKKLLKDLNGETISGAEIFGGYLRIYVGIVTLDPNAIVLDPPEAEVFSVADTPGNYDGTLTISSTVS